MEEVELSLPFSKAELITLLYKLIEETISRRWHHLFASISWCTSSHMYFHMTTLRQFMPILQKERPALWIEYGIRAISEPDTRWLRCDIKSLNLLPNVLAACYS